MTWIDALPTTTVETYLYQEQLYCKGCGESILANLHNSIMDNKDQLQHPQGPILRIEENDKPLFCNSDRACLNAVHLASLKVGCPLANPLTQTGIDRLRECILKNSFSKKQSDRQMGRLMHVVWSDYSKPLETLQRLLIRKPHKKIYKKLAIFYNTAMQKSGDIPSFYIDSEYIYIHTSTPRRLWRVPINEQGMFVRQQLEDFDMSDNGLEKTIHEHPWINLFLERAEQLYRVSDKHLHTW